MSRLCTWRMLLVGGGGAVLIAAAAISALAAALPVTTGAAGASSLPVPRCPTAGTTVFENVTGNSIRGVTVGGIDPVCAGGTLSLTVDNGSATGSGSAVVPVGGGMVNVSLGAPVPFAGKAEVDLVVTGP